MVKRNFTAITVHRESLVLALDLVVKIISKVFRKRSKFCFKTVSSFLWRKRCLQILCHKTSISLIFKAVFPTCGLRLTGESQSISNITVFYYVMIT